MKAADKSEVKEAPVPLPRQRKVAPSEAKTDYDTDSEIGDVEVHVTLLPTPRAKLRGVKRSEIDVRPSGAASDDQGDESEKGSPAPFRKSSRKTASKHSNPFNNPRSVLHSEISADFMVSLANTITIQFNLFQRHQ